MCSMKELESIVDTDCCNCLLATMKWHQKIVDYHFTVQFELLVWNGLCSELLKLVRREETGTDVRINDRFCYKICTNVMQFINRYDTSLDKIAFATRSAQTCYAVYKQVGHIIT